MSTLGQVIDLFEPVEGRQSMSGLASVLGAPMPARLRSLLDLSTRMGGAVPAGLRVMAQNMALMPSPFAPYKAKGMDREQAITALVNYVLAEEFDIVGLSECWVGAEKDNIRSRLAHLYGHNYAFKLEGPKEADLESDGGLLLLLKPQVIEVHSTIYRQCDGWDCLANKGALHARIRAAGHPSQYDVFLTHTQNPDEHGKNAARTFLQDQLLQLGSFIQAYSSPERPALLMGDLNTDAYDGHFSGAPTPGIYADMLDRLGQPVDLWSIAGVGAHGFTWDDENSFTHDSPRGDDAHLDERGERLDYVLGWRGTRVWPRYTDMRVLVVHPLAGRDLSDHFGVTVRQKYVVELEPVADASIASVMVALKRFHCLSVTGGAAAVVGALNSDEVEFELRLRTALGATAFGKTALIENIGPGTRGGLEGSVTLNVGDPGAFLDIECEGWEVDTSPFGETGRAPLGPQTLRLDRSELLLNRGSSVTRTLPLLTGDDGEYAVSVSIEAH